MEEATQQQRVVQDRMVGFNRVKQHGARLADRCGSTTFFDLSEWWFDSVYGFSLDLSQPEPGRDCGSMQASVSILPVLEGEAMCGLYQRYASYCGCENGVAKTVVICVATRVPFPLPLGESCPSLAICLGECEMFESALLTYSQDDPLCSQYQAAAADYCNCKPVEERGDDNNIIVNGTDIVEQNPQPPNNGSLVIGNSPDYPCNLCRYGERAPNPDAKLDLDTLPFDTCGGLQDALDLLFLNNSDICELHQRYSPVCGCEVPFTACRLCGNDANANISTPDRVLPFPTDPRIPHTTCELYEAAAATTLSSTSNDACQDVQFFGSGFCGCSNSNNNNNNNNNTTVRSKSSKPQTSTIHRT